LIVVIVGALIGYTVSGLGSLKGGSFFAGGFNRLSIRLMVLISSILSLESVRLS
jgi:hypothetical protein